MSHYNNKPVVIRAITAVIAMLAGNGILGNNGSLIALLISPKPKLSLINLSKMSRLLGQSILTPDKNL